MSSLGSCRWSLSFAAIALLLMTSRAHGLNALRWCSPPNTYSLTMYSNPEEPGAPLVVFGSNYIMNASNHIVDTTKMMYTLPVLDSTKGTVVSNTTTTRPSLRNLPQQVAVGGDLVYTSGTLPLPSVTAWAPAEPLNSLWIQPAVPAGLVIKLLYAASRGSVLALTSQRLFELDALTGEILRSWTSDEFSSPSDFTTVAVSGTAIVVGVDAKGMEWVFSVVPENTMGFVVGPYSPDRPASFAVRYPKLAFFSREPREIRLIDIVTGQTLASPFPNGTVAVASTHSSVLFDSNAGWKGFNWADGSAVALDSRNIETSDLTAPLQWSGIFMVMSGSRLTFHLQNGSFWGHTYAVSEAGGFQGQPLLQIGTKIAMGVAAANSATNEIYVWSQDNSICKFQLMG
jgi:hypothetical protein